MKEYELFENLSEPLKQSLNKLLNKIEFSREDVRSCDLSNELAIHLLPEERILVEIYLRISWKSLWLKDDSFKLSIEFDERGILLSCFPWNILPQQREAFNELFDLPLPSFEGMYKDF